MKRTFIIDWMTVFAYRNHLNAHFPIRISKLGIYISDTMYVRVREDLILCWILVFGCDRYIIGLNEWLGSVAFIAILILFVLNLKKRKRLIQDQWRHKGTEKKGEWVLGGDQVWHHDDCLGCRYEFICPVSETTTQWIFKIGFFSKLKSPFQCTENSRSIHETKDSS